MSEKKEKDERRNVARGCWKWMKGGKRPIGRPRKRWKDTVEEALKTWLAKKSQVCGREKSYKIEQKCRNMLAPLTGLKAYSGS